MDVAPELVERAAQLSRLELTPDEARKAAAELARMLEYMDVLNRLDARDTGPVRPASPLQNVLREDRPAPSLDRDELLAGAPASDGGTFLVPQAVE